jgi:mono/diheme cytochrome c family protein
MFGYGSVDWIEWMIRDPGDNALYRDKGREPAQMPSFKDRLSERERRLIAEWLHASTSIDGVPISIDP